MNTICFGLEKKNLKFDRFNGIEKKYYIHATLFFHVTVFYFLPNLLWSTDTGIGIEHDTDTRQTLDTSSTIEKIYLFVIVNLSYLVS